MRALLWLLAVFAAAAALAVAARFDQGYVQVAWGAWRIELSLLLAIAAQQLQLSGNVRATSSG